MKLLSWNIQWGRGMDGRVDLARVVRDVRGIGDFDVICLQEVAVNFPALPGNDARDQVAELSRLLPGYTPIYAPATDAPDANGGRKQFGNAIFSRLPVGQIWRHLLPWPNDPAVPSMQRVLLEVVVQTEFGPLRVLTTHLEYYSLAQRQAQIDAIRHLHTEACAHAGQPRRGEGEQGGSFEVFARPASALLCGDMNFPAEAPERARLLAPFSDATPALLDSWDVLHPGRPHAPSVGIHPVDFVDWPACFDFIFLTQDLTPRLQTWAVDAETEASDHQPVWVELTSS
jgi:endonuclease/exonuclease/phosphatase family metal-dependent hydrolase